MKTTQSFLALATIIALMTPLLAQHDVDIETIDDGVKKIVRIQKGGDMIMDPLNLTDSQKKEFKKLDLQFEKETISMKNELELKALEKEVELESDSPDLKKLNALIDAAHALQASMEKKRMAIELKKRDLLTEEQRKNWHPMVGMKEHKIIMLKGDGEHDMMWMHDEDIDIPHGKKIEKKIEIR